MKDSMSDDDGLLHVQVCYRLDRASAPSPPLPPDRSLGDRQCLAVHEEPARKARHFSMLERRTCPWSNGAMSRSISEAEVAEKVSTSFSRMVCRKAFWRSTCAIFQCASGGQCSTSVPCDSKRRWKSP